MIGKNKGKKLGPHSIEHNAKIAQASRVQMVNNLKLINKNFHPPI